MSRSAASDHERRVQDSRRARRALPSRQPEQGWKALFFGHRIERTMQSFEVRLCKWDYFGGHGYRIRAVQVSLFDRDQSAICATKSNQLSFPKSCRKHPAGALTDRRLRSGLRLQEHVEASQQRGRMKSTVVIDQLLANDGGATHRQRLECLHEKTSTCRDIPVVQDHRAMMLQYDDIVGVHAARPNEDAVAYQQRLQKALAPSVDRVRSLMGKIAELARRLGDASASRGFVDSNMAVAALGRTHSRTTGLPRAE
jgi:hypothetical protein